MSNYNQRDIFICPISRELFNEPLLADDGFIYEKNEIEKWLKTKSTSPLTGRYISKNLVACHYFSTILKKFYEENPEELINRYVNIKIHSEYIDEINDLLEYKKYHGLLNYSSFNLLFFEKDKLIELLQNTDFDIFKHFIDNIIDADELCNNKMGQKLIHLVCRHCEPNKIKYLVDKEIDLEEKTFKNWRPIHYVIKFSTPEIIKYLIDKGVDLECANKDGWRPIHYACRFSTPNIIQYLIEKGVDLECEDNEGWRPIHYACCNSTPEIIKFLILQGVCLTCKNNRGHLPVHHICKYCSADMIKCAIEIGLDLDCKSNKGKSSFDYIQKRIKNNNLFLKQLLDSNY